MPAQDGTRRRRDAQGLSAGGIPASTHAAQYAPPDHRQVDVGGKAGMAQPLQARIANSPPVLNFLQAAACADLAAGLPGGDRGGPMRGRERGRGRPARGLGLRRQRGAKKTWDGAHFSARQALPPPAGVPVAAFPKTKAELPNCPAPGGLRKVRRRKVQEKPGRGRPTAGGGHAPPAAAAAPREGPAGERAGAGAQGV